MTECRMAWQGVIRCGMAVENNTVDVIILLTDTLVHCRKNIAKCHNNQEQVRGVESVLHPYTGFHALYNYQDEVDELFYHCRVHDTIFWCPYLQSVCL